MAAPVRIYGAPWCPDCKRAKQFLVEQRVPYEWYDVEADEAANAFVRRVNGGKGAIPTLVFADDSILTDPTNAEIAAKLGLKVEPRIKAYDLIVVGGGPAGLTAGIYASREGLRTLVVERSLAGGQATTTNVIENYPGFPEPVGGGELAERLQSQAKRFGVEILDFQEVVQLYPEREQRVVQVDNGKEYCAPAIVVATGSTYRRLGVPGEDKFIGAGVHFCSTCDGPFYRDQDVFVVGGGNSAFQEGVFLTRFARSVTLLVRGKTPRASKILQEKVAERDSMRVLTETVIEELRGQDHLESLVLRNSATGEVQEVPAAAVFVYIGMSPNTGFLREVLELDAEGFVVTKPNLETSLPGVFAAGDCRRGSTKQIASAAGEGATAALMVREYLERRGEKARLLMEAQCG